MQDDKVLVLTYEDMLADLRNAVKQIANFLGETALKSIATEKQLADIVANCSFNQMSKQELSNFFPKNSFFSSFSRYAPYCRYDVNIFNLNTKDLIIS
jgi:hypothetical protein